MENGRELDRTQTLIAELAECRAALREKDLVLRDIHHRVKNNLQVIASLISLHARPGIQPELQTILDQLQGRVRAIAALHETLYSSQDLRSILFGSYMEQLLRELLALHIVDPARISVQVQTADIVLSMEQALPLGLILTELITNCLKHGFSQQQQGAIDLSLRYMPSDSEQPLDDAQLKLSVRAGETLFSSLQAIDMHIVKLLVAEVSGSLQVSGDCKRGAKFSIRFPLQRDEPLGADAVQTALSVAG